MNEKELFIENYLKEQKKFVLSSELIEVLMKEFNGITNDNARKIISNLNKKGIIVSSEPIKFLKNSYAYASRNKKVNYKNLEELIKSEKKQLYRAICLIRREKNVITYNELAKVVGCTISKKGNNMSLDSIIEELTYFGIISIITYKGIKFIVGKKIPILISTKKYYI